MRRPAHQNNASFRRLARLAAVLAPLVAFSAGAGGQRAPAEEIGFIEDFVLAKDREAVLAQLIPGTDDYYYYHCLHNQQIERFDRVEELLQSWIKRHGHTVRVREIQHRQALLTYRKSPEKTLDYLKRELGLRFDHQKTELNKKPNLPGRLDPNLIARDTLTQRALNNRSDLGGFEERALDWLIGQTKTLGPDRRRMLLQRLDRPDHKGLVEMIAADLNHRYSGGFGSLPIHSKLLLAQLDELLKIEPELRSQTNFVNTYLTKLHPKQDVDWRHNPDEKLAYLQRLWDYVETLDPAHNSLKAHVLYHRLAFDRSRGVYDKERFLAYIKLPRHMSYVERDYLNRPEHQRWPANLGQDFRAVTLLPPVGSDEPLVRDFLMHFFVEETEITPYATYIEDNYLKKLLAETKIVNGLGDVERWASMLPPEEYRQLKERIDLDFAPINDEQYAADEPVGLDVYVKNVRTLIVKVYEINTRSWYRETLREVDTDINLDGLVPNVEKTHTYDEPAVRRVKRHFEFPGLKDRGIYVIDFIGNGKSSRALVRKGRLHYILRTGIGGQVFTVLNEENEPVPAATLWLSGHEYQADKDGRVSVPFTNTPSNQPIVLCDGSGDSFCSLAHFPHQPENYTLQAAFHVDREQLLRRNKAELAVRPQLLLGGVPVTLSVLEDVRLTVTATDHDGISTTEEFRGDSVKLQEGQETIIEFSVPERLARLNVSLTAKVENLSQGEDTNLSAAEQFQVNQIDATTKTEDLFLAEFDGRHVVELLGRTGEPLADRPVRLEIKHRDFTQTVHVTLQTDPAGRIVLGALPGIEWVQATSPQDVQAKWPIRHDEHTNLANRHGKAGAPLEVAVLPDAENEKVSRADVSLLELRGDTFYADRFDALTLEDGILRLSELPRGDYDLFLKEERRHVHIRLTPGDVTDAYVLGPERHLQLVNPRPLQIAAVEAEDKALTIRLVNANKLTRVHLVATRYRPAWSAFEEFAGMTRPEPAWLTVPNTLSAYVEGRNIGDEYRYIIDRRYAPKFPGNMLERPSLLLNPWAVRDTQTDRQAPAGGDEFTPEMEPDQSLFVQQTQTLHDQTEYIDFSNLDFLGEPAVVLHNLTPDEDGVITVEREKLGPHSYVQVVALDAINTASRLVTLPEPKTRTKDLRLADSLDLNEHYALQKQVSVLKPNEKFTLSHLETARFEAYDSLQSLFVLFSTLSQERDLIQFRFLVDWPNLTPEEQREKYSEYACHEVDFFLYHKDPEFFRQVAGPFIANKKDKTFVDLWLTGGDLSRFLQPWEYGQLNAFEKVLLARRIAEERQYTERHLRNLLALQPPNVERQEQLFSTAVRGLSLGAGDRFGLEKAQSEMLEEEYLGRMLQPQSNAPADRDADSATPPAPTMTEPAAGIPAGGRAGGQSGQTPDAQAKKDGKPGEGRPGGEESAESYRRQSYAQGREADNFADYAKDLNGVMPGYFNGEKLANELKRRQSARQFFRKLDKTKEWIENYYWHVPLADCGPNLIEPSELWADYAGHDAGVPFYNTDVAESARNLHEILVALAVLDLPFEPQEHDIQFAESTMTVTPGSPMIAFYEEIEPTELAQDTPILVSQNFFRASDRYRYENGERSDKYITDEFLKHVVYGGQIVVTNPTSTRQKLRVLTQIPVGAIPVNGSQRLRSMPIDLQPYHTQTVEYYFYFPFAGDFRQYAAHVAKDEKTVAHAEPKSFHVVDEPSQIDRESWEFVSQEGSDEEVLTFLEKHNLHRLDLSRIAFRMRDRKFFGRVIELLGRRHAYSHVLWSYAIYHNQPPVIRDYLEHADEFLAQCGEYLNSPLVDINPLLRRTYQHRDYRPLVNARKHQLGREREILNDRLHEHYHHLLKILSYHRSLSDENRMAVVYYLLLQHRIAEALDFFEEVNPDALATRLQYDYFKAYLAMYQAEVDQADAVAGKYENYPVDRWREAFVAVSQQIDEIRGADVEIVDEKDRDQSQTKLAATEKTFDFDVEGDEIALVYQNLDSVQVNYYLMDVELLFSRSPFVQAGTERFAFIKPNESQTLELPEDKSHLTFRLPAELRSRNVLVQIAGGGRTASEPYYANTLTVTTSENYGQLLVKSAATGKPEPTVYVKVYARMRDGSVQFYKDGYTDLRGRFDYVSLSTNELENVQTFALLVLSDEHGAIVREAKPPQR